MVERRYLLLWSISAGVSILPNALAIVFPVIEALVPPPPIGEFEFPPLSDDF